MINFHGKSVRFNNKAGAGLTNLADIHLTEDHYCHYAAQLSLPQNSPIPKRATIEAAIGCWKITIRVVGTRAGIRGERYLSPFYDRRQILDIIKFECSLNPKAIETGKFVVGDLVRNMFEGLLEHEVASMAKLKAMLESTGELYVI